MNDGFTLVTAEDTPAALPPMQTSIVSAWSLHTSSFSITRDTKKQSSGLDWRSCIVLQKQVEIAPSTTVKSAALSQAAAVRFGNALSFNDLTQFKSAARSFLKNSIIKSEDILLAPHTTLVSKDLEKAFRLTIRLDKLECQLILLHFDGRTEQLTPRAVLSKVLFEDAISKGRTLLCTREHHADTQWLTKELLGLERTYSPGDFGISEHQVLAVRWRFWFALLSTDASLEAFLSALGLGFGSKEQRRNGILALLRDAEVAVNEALVYLGLLQPAEETRSKLGSDDQSVERVGTVGNSVEVEVLESEAPLVLSEQTGSFLGYGLYIFAQFSREGRGLMEQERKRLREIARNSHRPIMSTSDPEDGKQAIDDASQDHRMARSSRGSSSPRYGAQLLRKWVWRPWKKRGVR